MHHWACLSILLSPKEKQVLFLAKKKKKDKQKVNSPFFWLSKGWMMFIHTVEGYLFYLVLQLVYLETYLEVIFG